MTDRPTPRARRLFAGAVMIVALVVAGCGEIAPRLPERSVGPAPAARLGASCAAQWAASTSTSSDSDAGVIPVVLMPSRGTDMPAIELTGATLQTDQGPIVLSVSQGDDSDPGTTRLELGLPVLEPGTYRAEFLDLADASGTWRFRVGEYVITVLADAVPGDLEQLGGTGRTVGFKGGWVQFEVRVRNATDQPIQVTGATTDVPGLPVTWGLVELDPIRTVGQVAIPAGNRATLTVATEHTQTPAAFVLVTPEMTYRVGTSAERRAMLDPIEFQAGFGQLSDMMAYRATLPADACGRQR